MEDNTNSSVAQPKSSPGRNNQSTVDTKHDIDTKQDDSNNFTTLNIANLRRHNTLGRDAKEVKEAQQEELILCIPNMHKLNVQRSRNSSPAHSLRSGTATPRSTRSNASSRSRSVSPTDADAEKYENPREYLLKHHLKTMLLQGDSQSKGDNVALDYYQKEIHMLHHHEGQHSVLREIIQEEEEGSRKESKSQNDVKVVDEK